MGTKITKLSEQKLVEIRAWGYSQVKQFVDPYVVQQVKDVLYRRGEEWAESILGRELSRRSCWFPTLPWLRVGEEYILVEADQDEDLLALKDLEVEK